MHGEVARYFLGRADNDMVNTVTVTVRDGRTTYRWKQCHESEYEMIHVGALHRVGLPAYVTISSLTDLESLDLSALDRAHKSADLQELRWREYGAYSPSGSITASSRSLRLAANGRLSMQIDGTNLLKLDLFNLSDYDFADTGPVRSIDGSPVLVERITHFGGYVCILHRIGGPAVISGTCTCASGSGAKCTRYRGWHRDNRYYRPDGPCYMSCRLQRWRGPEFAERPDEVYGLTGVICWPPGTPHKKELQVYYLSNHRKYPAGARKTARAVVACCPSIGAVLVNLKTWWFVEE
jgi:hypothetical protein